MPCIAAARPGESAARGQPAAYTARVLLRGPPAMPAGTRLPAGARLFGRSLLIHSRPIVLLGVSRSVKIFHHHAQRLTATQPAPP